MTAHQDRAVDDDWDTDRLDSLCIIDLDDGSRPRADISAPASLPTGTDRKGQSFVLSTDFVRAFIPGHICPRPGHVCPRPGHICAGTWPHLRRDLLQVPKLRFAPALRFNTVHPLQDDLDCPPLHVRLPPSAILAWASQAPQSSDVDSEAGAHVSKLPTSSAPPTLAMGLAAPRGPPPLLDIPTKPAAPINRWCDDDGDLEALAQSSLRLSTPTLAAGDRGSSALPARPGTAPSLQSSSVQGPSAGTQAQRGAPIHAVAKSLDSSSFPSRKEPARPEGVSRRPSAAALAQTVETLRSQAAATKPLRGVVEEDEDLHRLAESALDGRTPSSDMLMLSPRSQHRLSQASDAERRTLVLQRAM